MAGDGWQEPEPNDSREYLNRMLGSRARLFARDTPEQRHDFGVWLKWMRLHTPWERLQPAKPGDEEMKPAQLVLIPVPGEERSFRHVSRAVFLHGFRKAFTDLTGVGSPHDERFVKRLEAGQVPLHPLIPSCASIALQADWLGVAILFEAAGCGGWDAVLSQLDEEESGVGTSFIGFIADGASGILSPQDIVTVLEALRRKLDDEFKKRGK